jgi:hypothetical protein
MIDIESKYQEFKKLPFPDGISGEEIHGTDLEQLRTKACYLIQKFIGFRGRLNREDFELLKKLNLELRSIAEKLSGLQRTYFGALWNLAEQTTEYLEEFPQKILSEISEQIHKRWKKDFFKIRKILNEWDPIGVADVVDDEYDDINFNAYSALINDGTVDDVKMAIGKYMNESLQMDVPDEELETIAVKIKNAVNFSH